MGNKAQEHSAVPGGEARAGFTPGPWLPTLHDEETWRIHGTGLHGEESYAVADVINGNGFPQNKANLYLIAAAPAMFKALDAIVAADDKQELCQEHIEAARAAISLALGEKQ